MLNQYVLPRNKLIDQRSRFVVQEINRLLSGCADLQQGNLRALGKKMYETHTGLSNLYEVSCEELDWLVDQVRRNNAVIGARMMGGGFGGCTINLVKEEAIDELYDSLKPAYESIFRLPLTMYQVAIGNGTEVISQ
jgi:galactokinase